jgi:hypothetical protein
MAREELKMAREELSKLRANQKNVLFKQSKHKKIPQPRDSFMLLYLTSSIICLSAPATLVVPQKK